MIAGFCAIGLALPRRCATRSPRIRSLGVGANCAVVAMGESGRLRRCRRIRIGASCAARRDALAFSQKKPVAATVTRALKDLDGPRDDSQTGLDAVYLPPS
ncbi:hypothetical protein [Bradyrhizobium liaoningense]